MGDTLNPAILFIHGWPTNWSEFEKTMEILSPDYYVLALNLPGIGASTTLLNSYNKANIASYIYELLNLLDVNPIAFVGCDIGGQIVYSFLKKYPDKLSHAVMMHVAIPVVNPWESIERNPYLWHFAFHSIPKLPEELVMGHQKNIFHIFMIFYVEIKKASLHTIVMLLRMPNIQKYTFPFFIYEVKRNP